MAAVSSLSGSGVVPSSLFGVESTSLAGLPSPSSALATSALFVMLVPWKVLSTVIVTLTVVLAPAASAAIGVLSVATPALAVQFGSLSVNPVGIYSLTCICVASSVPWLVTVISKVTSAPSMIGVTVAALSVFIKARSKVALIPISQVGSFSPASRVVMIVLPVAVSASESLVSSPP